MPRTIFERRRGRAWVWLGLVLLALTLLPVQRAGAQVAAEGIAAVVNDDIVTTGDLEARIAMTLIFSNLPGDPRTQARVAPQVLRRIIDERLQLQEAKRLGNAVTPAQIDASIERLAAASNLSAADMIAILGRRGVSEQILRDQVRAELAWYSVVQSELARRVVVTDEQVDLALGSGRAAQGTSEVRLGEILLPVYDQDQEEATLEDARDLVSELRSGADFAALAEQFSIAATRASGGELGWVPTGDLASALKPVVADLAPGEVSDPLRTPVGVYIVKLLDRRQNEPEDDAQEPTAEARAAKRRELEQEQVERLASRYMRDLRADAFIDARLGT